MLLALVIPMLIEFHLHFISFRYHGEKLLLNPGKKAKTDFYISTVYDEAKHIDGGDTLLRRQPNTSMKYRGWQPGGSIGQNK